MNNMKGDNQQRLFTIKEAANRLRVSTWLLYKLIGANQLQTVSIASRRFVASEDIENFIENQKGKYDAS